MTRTSEQPPWVVAGRRARATIREVSAPLATAARTAERPRIQMALIHFIVVGGSIAQLALQGSDRSSAVPMWLVILVGLALLRVTTTGAPLATSTLVLEPIGVTLFLAGTGGSASPFFVLSIAGIWWASRASRGDESRVYRIDRSPRELRLRLVAVIERTPSRGGLVIYVVSLITGYLALVVPVATRSGSLGDAVEQIIVMVGVFALSEALIARAPQVHAAGPSSDIALDPGQRAIRDSLARALRTVDIPVEGVLAAARVGLTARQAEMVAYLMLGLSNLEIADAVQVSEATVRYRLTSLYRTLGVKGRKQAAERARELGLTATPRNREDSRPA